ncbi:hypothetical protein RIF29_10127 [Crotalaria pallida]|uniref:WRKY domain-containing protein n=1 Tax=Crotalaria pallida TaxID=3830 RepID=A0AAN9FSG7_CROPI
MEFGSQRSDHRGGEVKDEKSSESGAGGDEEDYRKQETVIKLPTVANSKRAIPAEDEPSAPSTRKEEVDEIENAKAQMGAVIEENQRLKMCLNRVLNDYRTLQVQFHSIAQQEAPNSYDKVNNSLQEIIKESELVSLSLGRLPRKDEKAKVPKQLSGDDEEYKKDLALGLDCKFETSKSGSTNEHLPKPSPENSSQVPKEEAGETWPPSKVLKTLRDTGDDEISQEIPAKKTRVCVRARCDTPTLNDGCQWRKYGQKISKGNPCPRAYYRCTIAQSCPVRKQVQRCAQDMSILITTYEGTHNHPLPLSATAIASTTSAAASMLLSGSSTSHSGPNPFPSKATTTTTADLDGLMNFYLPNGTTPKQFYLSHPSLSISSPSQSHPTITLDLASNLPSSSAVPLGARFTSNYNPTRPYPSPTSLNFSSSQSNAMSWSNNGLLSYNTQTQPYSNNINSNDGNNVLSNYISLGRQQPMENIYHSYLQRNNNNNNHPIIPHHQGASQHSLPADTIVAATKAITADPSFQSALAAALTSIIGTGRTQVNQSGGENLGFRLITGSGFVVTVVNVYSPKRTFRLIELLLEMLIVLAIVVWWKISMLFAIERKEPTIVLCGKKFTYVSPDGTTLSKLDKFLVFIEAFEIQAGVDGLTSVELVDRRNFMPKIWKSLLQKDSLLH